MQTTHPFSFRGREGTAAVTYQGNDDPERWGYGLLELRGRRASPADFPCSKSTFRLQSKATAR